MKTVEFKVTVACDFVAERDADLDSLRVRVDAVQTGDGDGVYAAIASA